MSDNVPIDVRTMPEAPALSATSDAPVITPPASPPPPPAPEPKAAADAPKTDEGAAEGGEGEAGEAGETPPAEPQAPARPVAGRMAELAAARRQAEEERRVAQANVDRLSGMVEKLLAERTAAPASPPPPPEPPAPKPQRESFADPDSYDSALIEWASSQSATIAAQRAAEALEQRLTTQREQAEQERAKETQQQNFESLRSTWNDRRAKTIEEHPDFEDVAEGEYPVSGAMMTALLHSENGPDVLYHLGQNRTESARIAGLDPFQQAVEIGKLSATLAAPRARPSRLPPPSRPLGTGNAAAPKDPSEMSMEEYAAYRTPKLAEERGNRPTMFGRRPN